MSYIGKNPKVDSVKLDGSATVPTGAAVEGQVYFNTGTGSISEGLKVYKNSQFVSIDKQLGDADTIDLLKASDIGGLQWGVAINSTSTEVGMNSPVPQYNATATGFASTSAFANSSTGNALLTNESADIVFAYESGAANCKNDYFGIQVDIPKAFRGQNLVLQFEYRTEEASGASSDNDFLVSIQDDTNKAQTTNSTTTGSQAAGTSVAVASSTGFAVGDFVRVESGTGASGAQANSFTEAYVTAIADSTHLTFSETIVFPASGTSGIIAANWLIDQNAGQLVEADSDTNKVGKVYKVQFKTEETTAKINISIMNQSTTTAGIDIFIDNILISANKFLQASSQTKSEYYFVKQQDNFWDASGSSLYYLWDASLITPGAGTPALAESKLVEVADFAQPDEGVDVTRILAKQDIMLDVVINSYHSNGGELTIRNSASDILQSTYAPNSASAGYAPVGASIKLAKNDYVYFRTHDSGGRYGSLTFTATPQTSPVILLESQDEIFTDWTAFTPTITGAAAGSGSSFLWRRVGGEMEIRAHYNHGTRSATTWSMTLPDGYSIATKLDSGTNYQTAGDYFVVSTNAGNHGGVISYLVGEDKVYRGNDQLYNSTSSFNPLTPVNGDAGATGDAWWTFKIRVPIQGWNANFNPLLSMPLVEIGRDMEEFQAWQISTGSTAYAPVGWDNVEVDTTGDMLSIANASTALVGTALQRCKVTINWTQSSTGSNWFWICRNQPASTAPSGWTYGGTDRIQTQGYLSASGGEAQSSSAVFILEPGDEISAISGAAGTAFYDTNYRSNFSILVEKDRSSSNMAHIIKPAVAVLGSEYAYNVAGGASGTGSSWRKRTVNTVRGDSWFVTLSGTGTTGVGGTNTDFTLEAGTYELFAAYTFYQTGQTQLALYDETNSTYPAHGIVGQNQYLVTSTGDAGSCDMKGTFTITSSTEYSIYFNCPDSGTLGNNNSFTAAVNSCYGQIVIRKLK